MPGCLAVYIKSGFLSCLLQVDVGSVSVSFTLSCVCACLQHDYPHRLIRCPHHCHPIRVLVR